MNEPPLRPTTVDDGEYVGVWGGAQVKFICGNEVVFARTKIAVRGINIPCLVTYRNGEMVDNPIPLERPE